MLHVWHLSTDYITQNSPGSHVSGNTTNDVDLCKFYVRGLDWGHKVREQNKSPLNFKFKFRILRKCHNSNVGLRILRKKKSDSEIKVRILEFWLFPEFQDYSENYPERIPEFLLYYQKSFFLFLSLNSEFRGIFLLFCGFKLLL